MLTGISRGREEAYVFIWKFSFVHHVIGKWSRCWKSQIFRKSKKSEIYYVPRFMLTDSVPAARRRVQCLARDGNWDLCVDCE